MWSRPGPGPSCRACFLSRTHRASPSTRLRVDGSSETNDREDRRGFKPVARRRGEDGRSHFYSVRSSLAAFETRQETFTRCADLLLCVFNQGTGGPSSISDFA